MRKKLMILTFALAASAAALGLFSPKPAEACPSSFFFCCPDGTCLCCSTPCFRPSCP